MAADHICDPLAYCVVTETVLVAGNDFAELSKAQRSVSRLMTCVDLSSSYCVSGNTE